MDGTSYTFLRFIYQKIRDSKMKKLFERTNELRKKYCAEDCLCDYKKDCPDVIGILCEEYPNIPCDIIKWFIVRHYSQANEIMQGLEDVDAHKIIVSKKALSNDELQNKNIIENAPFTSYDEVTSKYKDAYKDYYFDTYFPRGTWQAPIVAVKKKNGKLLVIDGTNRFRHMLIALYNKYEFIAEKHLVYIFEQKE